MVECIVVIELIIQILSCNCIGFSVAVVSYIWSPAVFIWCSLLHFRVRLMTVRSLRVGSSNLFPHRILHHILSRTAWKDWYIYLYGIKPQVYPL